MYLGNLDAVRDWGYAKDYVEGMWLMLQADKPQDYVLATGNAISVREFCNLVFRKLGMDLTWSGSGKDEKAKDQNGNTIIRIDKKYFRPTEVPFLLGDATKAREELKWHPTTNLEQLIAEMIDADSK